MVKNIVTICLMIFIIAVISILGAAVFINPAKTTPPTSTTSAITNVNNMNELIFAADVTKHNSAGDCWFIISGKVYDVTNFIPVHSGGMQTIIPYCGKDATAAFDTKNGMGQHSQKAQNILNNYYVGNIGG